MSYTIAINDIQQVTHDVKQFRCEKPEGYSFTPGQATEVAINQNGWKDEKRPFTFTSLNEDPYLEFVIKIYEDHDGVTKQLDTLDEGDELIIDDPWGTIQYKGPGTFIAGGAGVTPFIAIFRDLHKKGEIDGNRLLFSNKTEKDIILKEEFEQILGDQFINTITHEDTDTYLNELIDKDFLAEHIDDFDQYFYLCGPIPMVMAITNALNDLGADTESITFEE